MEFFRLVIPLLVFLLFFIEIGKNYTVPIKSVVITIVSNITMLVSQSIIFFGYFVPMNHSVNKKTSLSSSPIPLSPTKFSPGLLVLLQEILDQPSIAVIRLFAKDNAFSKKIRFFLLAHCWSVLILLFSLYIFYGVFFYSSAIMKLRIKSCCYYLDTTSIILSYFCIISRM